MRAFTLNAINAMIALVLYAYFGDVPFLFISGFSTGVALMLVPSAYRESRYQ